MTESARVVSGSLTKGSNTRNVGLETVDGQQFDAQRDGYSLRDFNDLFRSNCAQKFRVNSDTVRTHKGRDIISTFFNDTDSPTGKFYLGRGRMSVRFGHFAEQRDLGQTDIYDDDFPFFDTQDISSGSSVRYVQTPPHSREMPLALVDASSMQVTDGVIDVFDTRLKVNRTILDAPFFARGARAGIGHGQDSYRRSIVIADGKKASQDTTGEYFLDTGDFIASGSSIHDTVVSDQFAHISPFRDELSDRTSYYRLSSIDPEMSFELMYSRSLGSQPSLNTTPLDNYAKHEKMSSTGFTFENNSIGVDSIAFGGLIK